MNLRQIIFWTLDFFKGSPLKSTLRYTQSILESKDRHWVDEERTKHLQKLLRHATETTAFYKTKRFKTLQDFPVVNKNRIRDNFDAFFSDKFQKENCTIASTSGSTGAPFQLYQNKEKVRKIQADNLYYSSQSNYQLGGFLVFIRIWPKYIHFKLQFNFLVKNFKPWNILCLSDAKIAELISQLNKRTTAISFLGYPTAFEKICNYIDTLEQNPIRFKTKSIITISESLNSYTKTATKHYFGITPLSRYSNNETGIMAQQLSAEETKFRINDSSYIMEILALNEDKVLPDGEAGRIVLTDLYNLATPLIRYDTGDIGIMEHDAYGRPFFSKISGRKVDQLYNTKGELISSHLSLRLMDYGQFKQFQLIQKSRTEYHINLNTNKAIDEVELISDYKAYFGDDAIIKVNYVDEIPLLASGKRREVVNEFYT
ncbi:phenylacetate--CoA ligase family protein [Winogradskyella sp. PC D3.3]